jgi:phospholipid transport system substrate-binding protein
MGAKNFFAISLLCLTFGIVSSAHADGKEAASAFANDLGHKSLSVITDAALSKTEKQAQLEELFTQSVDIDWIGQFVLGRYWKTATEDQKQHYLANYRAFTVRHYTTNLSSFTDANFEVAKIREDDKGGNIVTMRIKRPHAEDVVTDFDVRPQQGNGLKVYDIVVEGVSMITTQRSEFNSVISQKGLDYLIDQLKQRSESDQGVAGQKN